MKVIVTGGAGFIGSNLVRTLLTEGYDVTVIDNLATGKMENLYNIRVPAKNITLKTYSIENEEELQKDFDMADTVFHLAALPSVPRSLDEPLLTHNINATGTLKVLEAAKKAKVKRVVYASSSSVYGMRSPYAVQKKIGEDYCRLYNKQGLETVILRYFNVYGPNQRADSSYAAVIPRFMTEKKPVIYGDGKQTRMFTYVTDAVEATVRASFLPDVAGQAFDVAGAESTSVEDLLKMIRKKVKPKRMPARIGEVKHSTADLEATERGLSWAPQFTLEYGLKMTKELKCEY